VRINTNSDDFDLTDELFARALDSFDYHAAPGIIVDLRQNDGGALLGFAGYLTDQVITLAQLEYHSLSSGAFEPDGPPATIEPIKNPYHFKLAVLVDQGCYSACELEAYGLSQVAGAIVVGQYPTAGVEAEVSQGQFNLPDDLLLQAPTGRYVQPDGQLFLEGRGVAPTLRVPLNRQTLLADDDVVLQAAEQALLK
jgi:C-terminal processing protease CtpA/Prc